MFDGHGRIGETVAQFVIDTLPTVLAAHPLVHSQPGTALEDAFQSVDKQLASHCDAGVSGTTAVAALVRGNRMWLANAGDSRAILVRQRQTAGGKGMTYAPVDLTIDHKPDTPDEMRRITQAGGHVTPAGANGAPARVWHKLRGLAMSRSIGDHNAASVGVISKPEITEHEVGDDDVALVIVSDGVTVQQQGQSGPLAAPQLGSCASSGRAWRLSWAARRAPRVRLDHCGIPATASAARASRLHSRRPDFTGFGPFRSCSAARLCATSWLR